MRKQLEIWVKALSLIAALMLIGCSGDDKVPGKEVKGPCGKPPTGYEGDELCMEPPDPSVGLQIHIGPKDYNDPAEVEKFLLAPHAEETLCYYMNAPNAETVNFYEQQYRMRPGSHHLIMYMKISQEVVEEGWRECERRSFIPIGGTQRSVSDFPPNGIVAPEDQNLYRPLLPRSVMKFELHFVNRSDKPILREVWINLLKKEVNEQSQLLGGVFMIGGLGMNVLPNTQQLLNYKCALNEPERRIVSLFGHRHAHTERFSVWVHQGGERKLIYEDYDWDEPAELSYNTLVENASPDPARSIAGGSSGILNMAQGDVIEWECDVNNTSGTTLTFRNEVYTGEMCNLFGSSVSPDPKAAAIWYCVPERQTTTQ